MHEDKMLNENDEVKVAGGIKINGKQKTLLEKSEIKKYEYRCNICEKTFYKNNKCILCGILERCPHCGLFAGCIPTGVMLFEYDYINEANWRSVGGQDT